MDLDIQTLSQVISDWFVQFYNSPFVLVVKILIGLYVLLLFADIVLLLILRDVPSHFRTGMKGMDMPMVGKNKMQKRWDKVRQRLQSDNVSQYKVAIIEADAIAEELLDGLGYKGSNMSERLEQVPANHLDNHLEALKNAHAIRNHIVHDADFVVDSHLAESTVGLYEEFLKYLELL
ncbi:MAG TPA: hypothetical protein VF817_00545 [Patescibacteria group bacterium]